MFLKIRKTTICENKVGAGDYTLVVTHYCDQCGISAPGGDQMLDGTFEVESCVCVCVCVCVRAHARARVCVCVYNL